MEKKNSSVEKKSFYELTYTNERNRNTKTLRTNSTQLVSTIFFFCRSAASIFSRSLVFVFHFNIFLYIFVRHTVSRHRLPVSYLQLISIRLMTNHTFADHINGIGMHIHTKKKDSTVKNEWRKAKLFFFCQICYLFYLFS